MCLVAICTFQLKVYFYYISSPQMVCSFRDFKPWLRDPQEDEKKPICFPASLV